MFYVDADCNHGTSLAESLYRAAEHTKDYHGGPNRFAGYNGLPRAVADLLKDWAGVNGLAARAPELPARTKERGTAMTTRRFDPEQDVQYGHCLSCPERFATQEDADEHLSSSFDQDRGKSHRIRITNRARSERIRTEIVSIVDDALTTAVEKVAELVDQGHITQEEAEHAVRNSELADAWDEYHFENHGEG